jgi:glyceraldehyde 3-phosphate dehydrogenase
VHAYTNQQRLADVPAKDPRRGRAAAENIIPQETNAARMVMQLIPGLEGRISGEAMNVPVPNGSCIDLVSWHEKPVTVTAINEVLRTAASAKKWQGILHYEDDPIVSSDIIRSPYSSTFDSLATMVLGERISKTIAWYDNGWGYAHRVVDLIRRFGQLEDQEKEAA